MEQTLPDQLLRISHCNKENRENKTEDKLDMDTNLAIGRQCSSCIVKRNKSKGKVQLRN